MILIIIIFFLFLFLSYLDMQEVLGENLESELVDETEVDEPYNVPDLSWMLAGMVEKKEKP
jgi:hypothetical protein